MAEIFFLAFILLNPAVIGGGVVHNENVQAEKQTEQHRQNVKYCHSFLKTPEKR